MRKALRFLGIFLLCLALLGGGAAGYIYLNKDAIIQGGVAKINDELTAPVSVSTIELDVFGGFPRVRIQLNDVRISDLLEVQEVGLGMNVLEVIKGTYRVEELVLKEGKLYLESEGAKNNWTLLKESEEESSPLDLDRVVLTNIDLDYFDRKSNDRYTGLVKKAVIGGTIDTDINLGITATIDNAKAIYEGSPVFDKASLEGKVDVAVLEDDWRVISSETSFNGTKLSYDLSPQMMKASAGAIDVVALEKSIYSLDFGDIDFQDLQGSFSWKAKGEQQMASFTPTKARFIYNGFIVEDFRGGINLSWGETKSISVPEFSLKTTTGEVKGKITISGSKPFLKATLEGGSNLSELFQFVEVEVLKNPMGFWKGTGLKISQGFKSWDDFTPQGMTGFEGAFSIANGSFGLSESTIEFEKIEADLVVQPNGDVRVERCFLQSGANNAVLTGTIQSALGNQRPKVVLRAESPNIDIDPLLYWDFEDDGSSTEDFGFDFEIGLAVAAVNMGDFDGTDLQGTVYNRGTKILGKEMMLRGCGGSFSGNWALAEQEGGARFWSKASATSIQMDELLRSFNSFDIEDLDESNLSGTATFAGEMTFHFDEEWDVISSKTSIDGQGKIVGGELKNYAPLEELGAFIDQGELQKISFPEISGSFAVRGDTLILPETFVENSAINFWVNGWQNLETDHISYSVRLGLKDLALRGKNSNRDLGNWVQEAENSSQPYIRLLIECNLDDVCISLDKQRIKTKIKENLRQEKEDLKTLFKERDEPKKDASQGSFELLWPEESDSLKVQSFR